mgnify:CR=1 FL=1
MLFRAVIIGLRNKKATGKVSRAHIDSKGFFVKYDPQVKMNDQGRYEREYVRETGRLNKRGRPIKEYGPTIPTNRTVTIKRQAKNRHTVDNDGRIEADQ